MELKPIEVKFRNLPVGYYFIFNDRVYLKTSELQSLELYSYLKGVNHFTNVFTPYYDVKAEFDINKYYTGENKKKQSFLMQDEFKRASNVSVSVDKISYTEFNPDTTMVGFLKRNDLKKYLVEFYNNKRSLINFDNIEIGGFFFYPKEKRYYKKISYYNAMPIYNDKYGLDDNENINISVISSAVRTTNTYNSVYYNGEELIKFDLNAWNIFTFSENFKTYDYKSFDTERNWTVASNEMLEFIEKIDDGALVFITNSNNSLRANNIKENKKEVKFFDRIYDEYENADKILSTIGLTRNIINNIEHGSTILLVCKKNENILHYAKQHAYHSNMKYDKRETVAPYILEYTYSFNTSEKEITSYEFKSFELSDQVIISNMKEVTFKLLYDLPEVDPRSIGDIASLYEF